MSRKIRLDSRRLPRDLDYALQSIAHRIRCRASCLSTITISFSSSMIPAFGDEWKRKINLGGASSSTTPANILNRVQAERAARAEHKQRTESAIRIQAWYRGVVDARSAKRQMRRSFEKDILGLTGLRCLVLIGTDADALATWCDAVLKGGPGMCFVCLYNVEMTH